MHRIYLYANFFLSIIVAVIFIVIDNRIYEYYNIMKSQYFLNSKIFMNKF